MRTKVFVGNLSFATKENELAKEFEASGKVISANIITRGPRSLGYGFVEMDNEQDAANAVKLLDKKEIDGRPINVEVAKQREEGAENAEKPQGGATRGRGGARGTSRGRGRGGARGAPRGGANVEGGQRRRFKRREDEGEEGTQQQQQGEGQQGESSRGRGRGGRRGGVRGASRGSAQPRPPREQTEKKEDTRAPSKTTLFVANLPFTLDDEGFSKIFKDNSLAYKSAHVVKKRSGRSKGFGFVEFDNEVDQQKALTAIDKKQVEGREVVVKVALTENKPTEGETSEKKETTTATTTATDAKVSTPKTENKATTASPKTDKK